MFESGIFQEGELIACYSTPSLSIVYAGNKVMIKSGGPKMTVMDDASMFNGDAVDQTIEATCQYEHNGELITHSFPLVVLTCWGAE